MTKRTGIQLCYPLELKRLNTWLAEDGKVIIQPKYDGDRCRALLDSQVTLLSSEEHDRNFALPHIAQAIERFRKDFNRHGIFELDGELYTHGWKHEDIHSVCSRAVNRHPDYMQIEYHIFDHIAKIPQYLRIGELYGSATEWNTNSPLKLAPTSIVTDENQVMNSYRLFIEAGYEGIIVRRWASIYKRSRSTDIMKFKPKQIDDYTIIALNEEISKDGLPKNRLGAFTLRDDDGMEFNFSAGLNDQQRVMYWNNRTRLVGRTLRIHYQTKTKYGTPKFGTDLELL